MSSSQIISLVSRIKGKANCFIAREMNRRGMEGLAPSHGDILVALFHQARLSMTELARIIDREKPTVTVLVDKLVAMGYVCKATDQEDKRITLVSLTPKGRALQPDFEEISGMLLDSVYRGVSDEEKELLMATLVKISRNL